MCLLVLMFLGLLIAITNPILLFFYILVCAIIMAIKGT